MTLRQRYLIVGIVWALLLGPLAAFTLFGFAAGASWLWLFGDSPWPDAAAWVLPLTGGLGGVSMAVVCVLFALATARRREAMAGANPRRERRIFAVLLAAPLLLMALLGAAVWKRSRDYEAAMRIAAQREAAFASLMAERHRIDGLSVDRNADGVFHATVGLAGNRKGDYRLRWHVVSTTVGTSLTGADKIVSLQPGHRDIAIAFTLNDLARDYRAKVLNGGGGVLVDEPFRLDVALEPVFNDAARNGLPPGERYRLDRGESPLRSQKSARFAVRFIIRRDGTVER